MTMDRFILTRNDEQSTSDEAALQRLSERSDVKLLYVGQGYLFIQGDYEVVSSLIEELMGWSLTREQRIPRPRAVGVTRLPSANFH